MAISKTQSFGNHDVIDSPNQTYSMTPRMTNETHIVNLYSSSCSADDSFTTNTQLTVWKKWSICFKGKKSHNVDTALKSWKMHKFQCLFLHIQLHLICSHKRMLVNTKVDTEWKRNEIKWMIKYSLLQFFLKLFKRWFIWHCRCLAVIKVTAHLVPGSGTILKRGSNVKFAMSYFSTPVDGAENISWSTHDSPVHFLSDTSHFFRPSGFLFYWQGLLFTRSDLAMEAWCNLFKMTEL